MTDRVQYRRCIFCSKRIKKGGNGNDILHHTIPICISGTYGWFHNKKVPPEVKELISKSRIPLCKSCHGKYHNLIRPLIELIISDDENPGIPPSIFISMLKSVDNKHGVRVRNRRDKMYRCFYCKDPVGVTEHQRVKSDIGPVFIDESDGFFDDDLFDNKGSAVVCRNCVEEAGIEAEKLLEVT